MPFVQMYMKKGMYTKEDFKECGRRITYALSDNLENTLPKMIKITFNEIPENWMIATGVAKESSVPTLVLQLGPGRSDEAIKRALEEVVKGVSESLKVPKDDIRFYIHFLSGENFAIGGKLKDFNKKVK